MSFWSRIFGDKSAANPGDPNGVEFDATPTYSRSLPFPVPSPWDGYPGEWSTSFPSTAMGFNRLIDTAWACIDLNAMVLSAMPVYLLNNGEVIRPKQWMVNPDPRIYTGWPEFAKQVFWDYQLGEVFIWCLAWNSQNRPMVMRVVPPWMVNAEMAPGGTRRYSIGGIDVTPDILHIRYQSTTDDPHGHGPLEVAGARITTAGLLQRYSSRLAETGGIPHYWIGIEKWLDQEDSDEMLDTWVESRQRHLGEPGVLTGGAQLHATQSMSAKEMALLELAQFSESRIAVLLGVPPFIVGLPTGGDSLTYSNVEQLFDFHDRASLGPKAVHVMTALSNWATSRPQAIELNRDEYSRPGFAERNKANVELVGSGILSIPEVRIRERFEGYSPGALVGNDNAVVGNSDQAAVGENDYVE